MPCHGGHRGIAAAPVGGKQQVFLGAQAILAHVVGAGLSGGYGEGVLGPLVGPVIAVLHRDRDLDLEVVVFGEGGDDGCGARTQKGHAAVFRHIGHGGIGGGVHNAVKGGSGPAEGGEGETKVFPVGPAI